MVTVFRVLAKRLAAADSSELARCRQLNVVALTTSSQARLADKFVESRRVNAERDEGVVRCTIFVVLVPRSAVVRIDGLGGKTLFRVEQRGESCARGD